MNMPQKATVHKRGKHWEVYIEKRGEHYLSTFSLWFETEAKANAVAAAIND